MTEHFLANYVIVGPDDEVLKNNKLCTYVIIINKFFASLAKETVFSA